MTQHFTQHSAQKLDVSMQHGWWSNEAIFHPIINLTFFNADFIGPLHKVKQNKLLIEVYHLFTI